MPDPKPPLLIDDVARVITASAQEADPSAAYRAVDAVAQRVIGHRLLTIMRYLRDTVEVERVYSSNLAAYPIGGRKPKQGTPWGERVLDRGEVYIARGPADIERAFSDHALISSLGVATLINVPILFASRCLGTLNIGHEAGRIGDDDVPTGKVLAGLLVPLLMPSGA